MVENPHQSDIVDEGFDALRSSQPPEGPSIQALERTLQAVNQARQKSNRVSLIERIKNMNKFIKYPVAAAIALAAIAAGAHLLWDRGAGIAFADVRQQIEQAETIASGHGVKVRSLLRKIYGPGRWRKRKGVATVRLANGRIRRVELHWYEAHGIGRRDFKIKNYLDES